MSVSAIAPRTLRCCVADQGVLARVLVLPRPFQALSISLSLFTHERPLLRTEPRGRVPPYRTLIDGQRPMMAVLLDPLELLVKPLGGDAVRSGANDSGRL